MPDIRWIKDLGKSSLSHLPIWSRQHPQYWSWKFFLERARYWPEDKIKQWQDERLRQLIQLAFDRTPAYRERLTATGINPKEFRGRADMPSLPYLNKFDLQGQVDSFSVKSPLHHINTTGGTTGVPLGFYLSRKIFAIENAFMHINWESAGWRLGDLSFVLRGGFIGSENRPWAYNRYRHELFFSSNHLSSNSIDEFVRLAQQKKPKTLQAYPSVLMMLCDLIEPGQLHFPILFLGSESLYDWQLARLQKYFPHSQIQCWYGHGEKAAFAPWVPGTQTYEPNPFYGYTELINDNDEPAQPGEEGEIVATGLFAWATPFIRYRTGDRAVRSLEPVPSVYYNTDLHFDKITGRLQEVIVTSSGRHITMTSVSIHGGLFDPFREFQFYQDQPGKLTLHFVPSEASLTQQQQQHIANTLMDKLSNDDLKIELQEVEQIARTQSGKWRYLDQRLPIKYHYN